MSVVGSASVAPSSVCVEGSPPSFSPGEFKRLLGQGYVFSENTVVMGDLAFSMGSEELRLPKGLQVQGDLDLSYCTGLTSLPEHLKIQCDLFLNECMSLTALPEDLQVQGNLSLNGCTSLTALPKWITTLRERADGIRRDVKLLRTGIPPATLERLRGMTLPGVEFHIDFPPTGFSDLKAAADFWLEVAKDATRAVPKIALEADQEAILLDFLIRLTMTAECRNPTTRSVLGIRIMDVLDAMAKNETIRGNAIVCMDAHTDTCHDAVTAGLDQIEQVIYIDEISQGSPTEEVLRSVGRQFFFVERIRARAVAFAGRLDPVEIHLAVGIGLAERFGLPMRTRDMIFRSSARITDDQIQQIGDVVARECTDKAFKVFLKSWSPWKEYQRRSYVFPAYEALKISNVKKEIWNNICPILQSVSSQPALYKGHIFDYESFKEWYRIEGTDPITRLQIDPMLVKRPREAKHHLAGRLRKFFVRFAK